MIETAKFYYNKESHIELANQVNALADKKGVSVSRWQNNSKNRVKVTYHVHTGDRNDFGSRQENVMRTESDESRRGGKIYDETQMMESIIKFLNTLPDAVEESDDTDAYYNIDDRYGDYVHVTIDDYLELNPDGNFEIGFNGIYEDGILIAEIDD
jgi:hypothetical protein